MAGGKKPNLMSIFAWKKEQKDFMSFNFFSFHMCLCFLVRKSIHMMKTYICLFGISLVLILGSSCPVLSQISARICQESLFFPEETRFPEKSVKPRNTQDLRRISNKTSLSFFKDFSGLSIRILIRKLNILMKT